MTCCFSINSEPSTIRFRLVPLFLKCQWAGTEVVCACAGVNGGNFELVNKPVIMVTPHNASSVVQLHLAFAWMRSRYLWRQRSRSNPVRTSMLPDSWNRYGMIENSYCTSHFVRGSVAWPASVRWGALCLARIPYERRCYLTLETGMIW